jgi:hypothetical protein
MASTYSNLKIQLMATGENSGTWGNVTNANLGDAIEQALVETATVTFASNNVTLTLSDSNSKQDARALRLNLTGTTAGARDLIVPAIQKPYIVNNGTADTITVKVSGQTGVAVPASRSYLLYNNGTDVVNALIGISPESGGTGLNAPGNSGNVLTSNGTAWTSAAVESFASGTVMLFAQTAAPTGFTKLTDQDNAALRVVSGTASTGGSVNFSTAFASQTPSGTVSVSGSAGSTTLSTPQIPSHSHTLNVAFYTAGVPTISVANRFRLYGPTQSNIPATVDSRNTANTGGGGSHDHPLTISSSTFTGNAINLAVKFVDVIRASKN